MCLDITYYLLGFSLCIVYFWLYISSGQIEVNVDVPIILVKV